ncbi:unnamed protein product [Ilex paraguariensis]|uniref:DUF962 domain-containing protein n=1 Tax=Ilex paraguariensis TaxID=185542 RepID=A0ABC8UFG1_9AQUA
MSMEEFWLFYMNQHSKPATRRWHFVGTLCSILCLIYSVLFNWWFLIFVPLFGYCLAWYSHFFVERNAPEAFGHPFWSLLCDFRMFGLMLTGQMDREIKRLGKRPVLQSFSASRTCRCLHWNGNSGCLLGSRGKEILKLVSTFCAGWIQQIHILPVVLRADHSDNLRLES